MNALRTTGSSSSSIAEARRLLEPTASVECPLRSDSLTTYSDSHESSRRKNWPQNSAEASGFDVSLFDSQMMTPANQNMLSQNQSAIDALLTLLDRESELVATKDEEEPAVLHASNS